MTDPEKARQQARERAQRARERAADAVEGAERVRRRRPPLSEDPAQAEIAAGAAELRDRRAAESARAAHKQAADLQEERARELAAGGDEFAARRAQHRADKARARQDHR